MALTNIEKLNQLENLDAWGQITDLGGEALDGSPNVKSIWKNVFRCTNGCCQCRILRH